jgi:hypothetical protein
VTIPGGRIGRDTTGESSRRAAGFVDAMREALRAYLRFAGVGEIEWAAHLGSDGRLFPIRP